MGFFFDEKKNIHRSAFIQRKHMPKVDLIDLNFIIYLREYIRPEKVTLYKIHKILINLSRTSDHLLCLSAILAYKFSI